MGTGLVFIIIAQVSLESSATHATVPAARMHHRLLEIQNNPGAPLRGEQGCEPCGMAGYRKEINATNTRWQAHVRQFKVHSAPMHFSTVPKKLKNMRMESYE